jgi:hypothetical protein
MSEVGIISFFHMWLRGWLRPTRALALGGIEPSPDPPAKPQEAAMLGQADDAEYVQSTRKKRWWER